MFWTVRRTKCRDAVEAEGMERTELLTVPPQETPHVSIRSGWSVTWRAFRKDRAAVAAGAILLVIFVMTLAAPWLSPYDPFDGNTALRLAPVGTPGHLLGVDGQGRDIFSRIL